MIRCVLSELSPLLLLLTGHHFMSQTDHQTNCCLIPWRFYVGVMVTRVTVIFRPRNGPSRSFTITAEKAQLVPSPGYCRK